MRYLLFFSMNAPPSSSMSFLFHSKIEPRTTHDLLFAFSKLLTFEPYLLSSVLFLDNFNKPRALISWLFCPPAAKCFWSIQIFIYTGSNRPDMINMIFSSTPQLYNAFLIMVMLRSYSNLADLNRYQITGRIHIWSFCSLLEHDQEDNYVCFSFQTGRRPRACVFLGVETSRYLRYHAFFSSFLTELDQKNRHAHARIFLLCFWSL